MIFNVIFKKIANSLFPGEAKSYRKNSSGIDFSEFKEYDPRQDPVKTVDIRASLKKSKLMTRVMEAEKSFSAIFVLDISPSFIDFSTGERTKLDLALDSIKVLSSALIEASGQVGTILFTDEVKNFIKPSFGIRAMRSMVDRVEDYKGSNKSGGRTDFCSVIDYTLKNIYSPSMFIIITDGYFGDPKKYKKQLARLSRMHDVLLITIRDKREVELPKIRFGQVCFRDIETGEEIIGSQLEVDNSLSDTCRQIGLAQTIIMPEESIDEQNSKLANLFSDHAKRRR